MQMPEKTSEPGAEHLLFNRLSTGRESSDFTRDDGESMSGILVRQGKKNKKGDFFQQPLQVDKRGVKITICCSNYLTCVLTRRAFPARKKSSRN